MLSLFHFSDNPNIRTFVPRRVSVPATRPLGKEWLNEPLVWSIDDKHQFMYLFPRECPRILIWANANTTQQDRNRWLGSYSIVAFIENDWVERLKTAQIYRYEMPNETFEDLADAGMWVSRVPVTPITCYAISNLSNLLAVRSVNIVSIETFRTLKLLWQTSLHVSGIRLRNARSW